MRIAFYTRISTDEDHQKYSLAAQRDRLEAHCRAAYGDDWTLFKVYRDQESGSHTRRPGLEEMLADAHAKAFDLLLILKVDRLSRSVADLCTMVRTLTERGVALKSITESFDTGHASGKAMLQMLGVFAEWERETIIERTKIGMQRKAQTGRFVGGYVPFGYRLEPGNGLVVEPAEATLVRKIFQSYAKGQEGVYTLVRKLNTAGYRNRAGKLWDRRAVLHLLRNPVYVGKIRWRSVLHDGNHPALITQALFDRTAGIVQGRAADLSGRNWHTLDTRPLTGVMECAACGSRMVGVSGSKDGRQVPYYACSKRIRTQDCDQAYIRADVLEKGIVEDVRGFLTDEHFLDQVWAEAERLLTQDKPQLDQEIAALDTQAAKARERRDRYFEAFETGRLKPESLQAKVDDIDAQLEQLAARRVDLEAQRERLTIVPLSREMVAALLADFNQALAKGTNAEKKQLLQLTVKKVLVHDRESIEIWYAVPNAERPGDDSPGLDDAVRTPTKMAPRARRCANWMGWRAEVWVRVFRVFRPRRGVLAARAGDTVEIGLGPEPAFLASDLVAPAACRLPRRPAPRPDRAVLLRRAFVWRALLAAGALTSRASLARWQGTSRARVTQVFSLLPR